MYCCRVRPMAAPIAFAQAKEEEGLRRLGYQNIRSRYQTRYRVDANTAVTISIEGNASLQIAD